MDQCWNDIAMVMPVAAVMAGLGLRPSTALLQIRDQGDHRSNTEHNIQPAQLLLSYNLVFPGKLATAHRKSRNYKFWRTRDLT